MKNFLTRWFFLAALLIASGANGAEPRRTDELMEKSGLNKQFSHMQDQIRAGAAQAAEQGKARKDPSVLSEQDDALFARAIATAFDPGTIQAGMRQEMERLLAASDEADVLRWLSSDLGRKFTRLEEDAGEATAMARIEREGPKLLQALPKERMDRVRRFVDSMRASESTAATMINVTTAMLMGRRFPTPRRIRSGC